MKSKALVFLAALFLALSCTKDNEKPCQECTFFFRTLDNAQPMRTDYASITDYVYIPSPIADRCTYLDTSKATDVQLLYLGKYCQ